MKKKIIYKFEILKEEEVEEETTRNKKNKETGAWHFNQGYAGKEV